MDVLTCACGVGIGSPLRRVNREVELRRNTPLDFCDAVPAKAKAKLLERILLPGPSEILGGAIVLRIEVVVTGQTHGQRLDDGRPTAGAGPVHRFRYRSLHGLSVSAVDAHGGHPVDERSFRERLS